MKISEIITEMTSAGAIATVVQPIANDVQRVAQRPKKPKKIGGKKKPGPKTGSTTVLRR